MNMSVGPFWSALESNGNRPALISGDAVLSHAALAKACDAWTDRARKALPAAISRPLVALELPRSLAAITAYLGCLRAGWPVVLLAEGEAHPQSPILATYAPNLIVTGSDATPAPGSPDPAAFCDDLAVLLSTSGTTGASKLVKLSATNLQANAQAIVDYLDIRPDDCTITTLPLHYSYGMSVLHTHLMIGARLVVTDAPLTDPAFWAQAQTQGITSLALVPTQFDLLGKAGPDETTLPRLRYVTQAGGRLDPVLAQHYARRAREQGWRLFLMYGQTEAAPRMAYLPPDLAQEHADKIGQPIPGGRLWIEDAEGHDITATGLPGELVYQGPNVMIGYALTRADLAAPRGTDILHTGDLARRSPEGLFQIVGRLSRFVKLNGLRIGLDEVEDTLRRAGHPVRVSGDDRGIVLFLQGDAPADLAAATAARYGLLRGMVRAEQLPDAPLLPSGKIDYAALRSRAAIILAHAPPAVPDGDLIETLSAILRIPDIDPDRSYRDLGGDSLAYLEVELYLLKTRGTVPTGWEDMPLRALQAQPAPAPRHGDLPRQSVFAWQGIGTDAVIRVFATYWVILLHTTSFGGGGVFALTMLIGYSLARHQLPVLSQGRAGRTLDAMLRPVLLPYIAVLLFLSLRVPVDWHWFALIANFPAAYGNPPASPLLEPYWFLSAYVQTILLLCIAFTLAPIRRTVAAHPFHAGFLATSALILLVAFLPVGELGARMIRLPQGMLVLVGIGWCVALADTRPRKLAAILLVLASYMLDWQDTGLAVQEAILLPPFLLLVLPRLTLPRPLARAILNLGALSLYIYILHVPAIYFDYHFFPQAIGLFLSTAIVSTIGAIVARTVFRTLDRWLAPVLLWMQQRAADLRASPPPAAPVASGPAHRPSTDRPASDDT